MESLGMERYGLQRALEPTVLFILQMVLTGLHLQMAIPFLQQMEMMLHGRVADGLRQGREQMFLRIHRMVSHGLQRLQSLIQLGARWHLAIPST
jgi:hypothetical protein